MGFSVWSLCPVISNPLISDGYGDFEAAHLMGLFVYSSGVTVGPFALLYIPLLKP